MRSWSDRVSRVVVAGSLTVLAGSVGVGIAHGDAVPQVTICHLPPGNPSNVQLLTVGAPAVAEHVLLHGDAVCAQGDGNCCAETNGEVCTNLQNDVNNCGACGTPCGRVDNGTAGCSSGACTVASCNQGYANCDGAYSNGCEVDLNTDANNCGSCGRVCASNESCTNGACTAVSVCQNYSGTGCYWMENYSGNFCWVPSFGFPSDVATCKFLDSCGAGGGGGSGGGCYRWADCSLCSTIYPNPTWP